MARYRESKCRLCRREGQKLFLKGDRCFTAKCAMDAKRKPYIPGEHGQGRHKTSDYGLQLREKQKVRRIYGILEKQFRLYFKKADRLKGVTGENLLSLLEKRLDNTVYRMGFSTTRSEARQLVRHSHFLVNGKKVNIPSFQIKIGDEVVLKEKTRKSTRIIQNVEQAEKRSIPKWIELDKENFKGIIKALPARDDVEQDINEQLIIELYSK